MPDGTHPEVAGFLGGVNDDFVALANTDEDTVSYVWYDGNEIGGDDCHIVAVNGESDTCSLLINLKSRYDWRGFLTIHRLQC